MTSREMTYFFKKGYLWTKVEVVFCFFFWILGIPCLSFFYSLYCAFVFLDRIFLFLQFVSSLTSLAKTMSSFNIEPMFDGYGKEMEMYHQQHDEALVEIRRNTEQAHLDLDAKAQVQIEEAEETLKLRTEHCKRKYIENLQVLFEDVEKKARMESTFFKVSFFSCFDDSLVYELFVPGHPERIPMKQTVSIPNLVCSYFYKTFHVSDFRQYGLPCSPSGRYTGIFLFFLCSKSSLYCIL